MALGNFRQNILPYCMEEQSDGGWVFLNREYQPIGFNKAKFYDYDRSVISLYFKKLTDKNLDKLSVDTKWRERWGKNGAHKICLYDGATNPSLGKKNLDAYFLKLAYLAKLQCREKHKMSMDLRRSSKKIKLIEHYISQKS